MNGDVTAFGATVYGFVVPRGSSRLLISSPGTPIRVLSCIVDESVNDACNWCNIYLPGKYLV